MRGLGVDTLAKLLRNRRTFRHALTWGRRDLRRPSPGGFRRVHRAVTGALAAAACLLTMAGCGSGSPAHRSDLVTPDQAKGIALAHLSKPTYSAGLKEDTGPLRVIEEAGLRLNPLPTPEPTVDPGIGHNVIIWVAHQSSYPLSFLAFDSPTVPGAQALPQLLRFIKASASSPWTVNFQVLLDLAATAPDVATDANGYAQEIPASRYGSFTVPPSRLAKDYAAYLSAGAGADATEFAPGGYTSGVIDGDNKLIRMRQQENKQAVTVSFTPSSDPISAYLLNDGGALVLVGVQSMTHVTPLKAGGVLTVTKDGMDVAGPAPGKYRDWTNELILLAALVDPAKGSAGKVSGLGAISGPVRSLSTPA